MRPQAKNGSAGCAMIPLQSRIASFERRKPGTDANKSNRSATLLCATCGGDQFALEGSDKTIELACCVDCGREFTKDELIEENGANINEHVKEMSKEIAQDMRDTLKKAFQGNKHIKLK